MRMRSWSKFRNLLACAVLTAMLASAPAEQSQAAPSASSPAVTESAPTSTPGPAAIPVPEIVIEAEAALARVRERMAEAPDSRTMPEVVQQFPLLTREIDARLSSDSQDFGAATIDPNA